MACGDTIIEGSPNVFANGMPVGRKGDKTSGHDQWIPSYMIEGSDKVFANGISISHIHSRHAGHVTYDGDSFHKTELVQASPNVYIEGE